VYPRPTILTVIVIFTLSLLAFFISLSMQMMNHLLLGDRLGMIVISVVLPLVIVFFLALLAARQYSQSAWIIIPATLLTSAGLISLLFSLLHCF
jgi:hypothetical protein